MRDVTRRRTRRQRAVATCAWLVVGVVVTGCALAVDWNALQRGQPDAADGSSSLPDAAVRGPTDDAASVSDAGGNDAQILVDSAPSTDSGVVAQCNPDVSVACSDPSEEGFACVGGGRPSDTSAALQCVPAVSSGTGETSYCCTGNYCGYMGDSADPPSCRTCYLSNCAAVMCPCEQSTDVDDAGVPWCSDYIGCVSNCESMGPSTLSQCENGCNPSYYPQEQELGQAIINCLVALCGSPCDWN